MRKDKVQGREVGKKSVPRKNPNEGSGEKHVRHGVRGCCLAADGSFRVLRMW